MPLNNTGIKRFCLKFLFYKKPISMKNQTIITKTEKIQLMKDGIVDCKVLGGILDLEGAEKYVDAIQTIGDGKKMRVFLDLRAGEGASQNARNYLAKEGAKVHEAMAMWVNSPFTKMLGNFFIGFSQPSYPTKLFTEKTNAIQWLKSF